MASKAFSFVRPELPPNGACIESFRGPHREGLQCWGTPPILENVQISMEPTPAKLTWIKSFGVGLAWEFLTRSPSNACPGHSPSMKRSTPAPTQAELFKLKGGWPLGELLVCCHRLSATRHKARVVAGNSLQQTDLMRRTYNLKRANQHAQEKDAN